MFYWLWGERVLVINEVWIVAPSFEGSSEITLGAIPSLNHLVKNLTNSLRFIDLIYLINGCFCKVWISTDRIRIVLALIQTISHDNWGCALNGIISSLLRVSAPERPVVIVSCKHGPDVASHAILDFIVCSEGQSSRGQRHFTNWCRVIKCTINYELITCTLSAHDNFGTCI